MNPTGFVTFLFTDIEGSTKLAQDYPDTLQSALEKHNNIMRNAIESNNGYVFEIVGDAFCCAFEKAEDAVMAAVDAQLGLSNENWGEAVIKIRIGIHSGNAEWNGRTYMGYITLARSARVMSCGYGEQIIISGSTYELCKDKFYAVKEKNISFRDLGERRMKDVIQPIRLYQIISPGLREEFPPLKTLDSRPNNLPIQLTSFIGREEVMRKLKKLIGETRLLTIIGSGGGGKTRLAMQIGADLIDDFANGVFIAELAPLIDPSLIIQTIMNALKLKEESGQSPESILSEFLKNKELLLILDNCEHFVSECSALAEDLLSKCPSLKIIATSREALNCFGEQTYRLPSLSLPGNARDITPENLTQYESVRLFIERALLVNVNFRVNNNNAPALAEICNKLDGIPLAIELAAARIKMLSIEKIHERLDDRFSLLTGGKRTALPRQQTLKAMIDWSYDLLPEKEKILWERLSIFSGGWTLEDAEEICSDDKISSYEILDLLDQLNEKSIIIYDEEYERYRILETIKQYGESRLKESNDDRRIALMHLNHFLKLSVEAEKKFSGNEGKFWIERLETEHNNLISAIEWSLKNGESKKGSEITIALGYFWEIRGHFSTGSRLTDIFLENKQDIGKQELSILYSNAGQFMRALGKFEKAQSHYKESIALKKETGDESGESSLLIGLGNIAAEQGDFITAKKYFEESLVKSRSLNYKSGIAFCLNNLGNIELISGNFEEASELIEESLMIKRELGEKRNITFSLDSLVHIALEKEDYLRAQKYLQEYLTITRESGDKLGISFALNSLGLVSFYKKEFGMALKYYKESLEIRRECGDTISMGHSLYNLCNIELELGNYERALELIKESIRIRYELGNKQDLLYSLISLSAVLSHGENSAQAALIAGAVEAAVNSSELILKNRVLNLIENTVRHNKENLSEDDYLKYFEDGKRMKIEEVVQLTVDS